MMWPFSRAPKQETWIAFHDVLEVTITNQRQKVATSQYRTTPGFERKRIWIRFLHTESTRKRAPSLRACIDELALLWSHLRHFQSSPVAFRSKKCSSLLHHHIHYYPASSQRNSTGYSWIHHSLQLLEALGHAT